MPPPTERPLRLALGGAVALAAAMGIGRFAYTPILPAMSAALGLNQAQAGMLASANVLGYLAGALLAALPVLRGSPRRWLVGALAVSAATTLLTATASDLAILAALRFLGGLASALVLVFAATLVLDRLAARGRPGLSALTFAGVGAGIVLSALLVDAVAAGGGDWRALWLAVGIAAAAAIPVVAILVPEPPARASVLPGRRAALVLGRPLAATMLAYFLFGVGYASTATFLVAIVRAAPDLRAIEPAVWLVVGLAACPSLALWNPLARRVGAARAFGVALVVEAIGVAGSALARDAFGALAAAALLGGTFVPITALGLLVARSLARHDERRIAALMTSAFSAGSIVAPPVAGWMNDLAGSFTSPTLAAAAALALAAVISQGASQGTSRGARRVGGPARTPDGLPAPDGGPREGMPGRGSLPVPG